jgi:hypothetical protein
MSNVLPTSYFRLWIRRSSKVVVILWITSLAGAIIVVGATLQRHIAGTAWSSKRYLNIELLKDQQMRGAITWRTSAIFQMLKSTCSTPAISP